MEGERAEGGMSWRFKYKVALQYSFPYYSRPLTTPADPENVAKSVTAPIRWDYGEVDQDPQGYAG